MIEPTARPNQTQTINNRIISGTSQKNNNSDWRRSVKLLPNIFNLWLVEGNIKCRQNEIFMLLSLYIVSAGGHSAAASKTAAREQTCPRKTRRPRAKSAVRSRTANHVPQPRPATTSLAASCNHVLRPRPATRPAINFTLTSNLFYVTSP